MPMSWVFSSTWPRQLRAKPQLDYNAGMPKRNPDWPDRTAAARQAEIQKRYKVIYNQVMGQAEALGYPRTSEGIQAFMEALENGQVQILVQRNP